MDYVNNILKCFQSAPLPTIDRGLSWYAKLNEWCAWVASDYETDQSKVAGVFAAISPMMPIDRNVDMTITLLNGVLKDNIEWDNLPSLKIGLMSSVRKAYNIMHSDACPSNFLGKWKTYRFYHNIMFPTNREFVTIDTWAYRIAMGSIEAKASGLSGKKYLAIENAYRLVADIVKIIPHQLQAITWEHVRSPHKYQISF